MGDGKVTLSNETEITTLDQPKAKIQVGAQVAQVSWQAFTGNRSVRSYETTQVGTIVNVTAKAANGVVTMDFDFEKSAVLPPKTEEEDDDEGNRQITSGGAGTPTQQGSIGLANGPARLVASMRERMATEELATQYLVTATIADGSELERSISIRSRFDQLRMHPRPRNAFSLDSISTTRSRHRGRTHERGRKSSFRVIRSKWRWPTRHRRTASGTHANAIAIGNDERRVPRVALEKPHYRGFWRPPHRAAQ